MGIDYEQAYPQGMSAINDPSTLFNADPDRTDWRVGVVIPLAMAGLCGIAAPALRCLVNKVPFHTAIYQYPLGGIFGYVVGKYFDEWRRDKYSLKDANFKYYLHLHQEDFPPAERKRVGELLKPWTPIR